MAKFGQFIHRVKEDVTVTFDTSYGSTKKITLNLNQIDDGANSSIVRKSAVYSGNIQLIRIKGTVSGSATQDTDNINKIIEIANDPNIDAGVKQTTIKALAN